MTTWLDRSKLFHRLPYLGENLQERQNLLTKMLHYLNPAVKIEPYNPTQITL